MEVTTTAEVALLISPFERSRWRLRRVRQPMEIAACFRLVFGCLAEAPTYSKWIDPAFAGMCGAANERNRQLGRAEVFSPLDLETPLPFEPKLVAISPGGGDVYEESIGAPW